jgi:uncharacterized protein YdeI (YjbR/CyaY-like superfamily)
MPKETQIVIPGLPEELVRQIDQLAAADPAYKNLKRRRSAYVRGLLGEIVAQKTPRSPKAA